MKQEACRVVVGRLLRAWRRADAFEPEFVDGLAASFFLFSSAPAPAPAPAPPPPADGGGEEGARPLSEDEEFSALTDKEVEMLASRSGVSLRGGRGDRLRRVARAREYGARRTGVGPGGGGGGGGGGGSRRR